MVYASYASIYCVAEHRQHHRLKIPYNVITYINVGCRKKNRTKKNNNSNSQTVFMFLTINKRAISI